MVGSNDGTSGSDTRLDMSQSHARTRTHFSDPRLAPDAQNRVRHDLRCLCEALRLEPPPKHILPLISALTASPRRTLQ